MNNDITKDAVEKALQMVEDGAPQHKILGCLTDAAETIGGPGSAASILVLDKNGLLRNAYSPQLPYDYLTAIDGLRPNAKLGTCASAAATGSPVFTLDFKSDDKWAELRHLPLALGYSGAWSMPIKNANGKVLGTFGTYYRKQHHPSQDEINAIQQLADTAAMVLE
jgi:GAF domain-containing protein